jgi:hypothetical protein
MQATAAESPATLPNSAAFCREEFKNSLFDLGSAHLQAVGAGRQAAN